MWRTCVVQCTFYSSLRLCMALRAAVRNVQHHSWIPQWGSLEEEEREYHYACLRERDRTQSPRFYTFLVNVLCEMLSGRALCAQQVSPFSAGNDKCEICRSFFHLVCGEPALMYQWRPRERGGRPRGDETNSHNFYINPELFFLRVRESEDQA